MNPIVKNEKFFIHKYTRGINSDITTVIKESYLEDKEKGYYIVFSLFGWDGINLTVQEHHPQNQHLQEISFRQILPKPDKSQPKPENFFPYGVVTDVLLVNNNSMSIISLADGQLFLNLDKMKFNDKSKRVIIEQSLGDIDQITQSYCKLGYFSYNNTLHPSYSKYYLIGVNYDFKVFLYESNKITEFSSKSKKQLDLEFLYVQYDEINQVLLGLCKDFTLVCYKMNKDMHQLESFQMKMDRKDLKNLGINTIQDLKSLDFQYHNEEFNIFILGNLVGIFCCSFKDVDDFSCEQTPVIQYIFDPIFIKQLKYKQNVVKIFSDKRVSKFKDAELTIIYEKAIIKYLYKQDFIQPITDLSILEEEYLKDDQASFQKYFCLYGEENVSYHILTHSNSKTLADSINSKYRLFVHKEINYL